jgi:hypothetical protein
VSEKFKPMPETERVFTSPFSENTEEYRRHGKYVFEKNEVAIRLNAIMRKLELLEEEA